MRFIPDEQEKTVKIPFQVRDGQIQPSSLLLITYHVNLSAKRCCVRLCEASCLRAIAGYVGAKSEE